MRRLIIVCLALTSACVSAQTYRWVDSAGRTVFSDTPPPSKAKSLTKTVEATEAGDNLPFALRKAKESFPVMLYTSADCGSPCQQARDLLNGRGVPFTEKVLKSAEEANELKQLVGEVSVPSMKIGNQSFRGFEAGAYNNLLDLAGYPKTAAYGIKPSGGLPPAEKTNLAGDENSR
jgi:glutaredoxin